MNKKTGLMICEKAQFCALGTCKHKIKHLSDSNCLSGHCTEYSDEVECKLFDALYSQPQEPQKVVCPKSTLCKYYTGENRCHWGTYVDDVKCNGGMSANAACKCLNYTQPESLASTEMLLTDEEQLSITTSEQVEIPNHLTQLSVLIRHIQEDTAKAQLAKCQQYYEAKIKELELYADKALDDLIEKSKIEERRKYDKGRVR